MSDSWQKKQAINILRDVMRRRLGEENIKRPFDVYKEDLVYNLIGWDDVVAKAVLRLNASDIGWCVIESRWLDARVES